jgi:hypothetical protein
MNLAVAETSKVSVAKTLTGGTIYSSISEGSENDVEKDSFFGTS